MKKRAVKVLVIALAIILVGSLLASLFNSSFGSVKVSRISFDTDTGTLSGLLYMPKDASESNPRPTVIVTHGYLNSAEMQDANAIELSRRGYVVLALDMYDHGHSKVNSEVYGGTDFFSLWSTFWIHSLNDAVQYMYEQPYVLKDAAGNGIIGVTGHSMGGFSSTLALAFDEQQAMQSGVRKVFCGLSEGSDFSYTALVGVTAEAAAQLGGGRTMGKVAAQYDEFFFNDPNEPGGTVRHKDFVATPDGQAWLEQAAPSANTWYDTADGGRRIIYEPAQTHPWNHFSTETTGYAIDFYNTAFEDYQDGIKDISSGKQIWQFKELFEFIALIGFLLLIVPLVSLITELPFFKSANTELAVAPGEKTVGGKLGTLATLLCLILIPGIIFADTFDSVVASETMQTMFYAGAAFALVGILAIIFSFKAEGGKKKVLISGIVITVLSVLLCLVAKKPMFQDLAKWTAPSVNSVASWTVACTVIAALAMSVIFLSRKSGSDGSLSEYGITFKPMVILAALCTAIVAVAGAYIVLYLVDLIFKTDFRIWVFAFKTWDANILPAVLRYLPVFFLFYFVSTASICVNTNTEGLAGVKGYFVAIALNAGGAIVWLAYQYITLFKNGVAAFPDAALSGIVLVAIACMLTAAACISRALYKRNGNIWTAAFVNALLVTISTVANTTVYFK